MPGEIREEDPDLGDKLARACNSMLPVLCVLEAMFEDYRQRSGQAYSELRDALAEVVHDVLDGTKWADDERVGVRWHIKGFEDGVANPV